MLQHVFCTFFFNAPPTPHIYTLSLHDALPISLRYCRRGSFSLGFGGPKDWAAPASKQVEFQNRGIGNVFASDSTRAIPGGDRKSTRLNSSHVSISYAVFCLKKKIKIK